MKTVMLGLLFICCSLFGLWVDSDEKRRLRELEQFIYLFELLKGEIDYQLTPLMEASRNVAKFAKGGVGQVFSNFASQLETGENKHIGSMWIDALVAAKSSLHLKDEDYKCLETFGGCCGYLDKNMQKRNLEMVLEKLTHERKQSEEKYARCSKLNRSLGVLIGGALVIFLI